MSEEISNLPPKANPLGQSEPEKPVLLKPQLRTPGADTTAQGADSKVEQLKKVTQNLKSITAPIPQQAILRNTGAIAGREMTEAQRAAAKARTSRIALSEAIGVAPVKEEPANPIKTIKIQRPKAMPRRPGLAPAAVSPQIKTPPAAVAPEAPAAEEKNEGANSDVSITQKRTIKVARPMTRPKIGIKKPGATIAAAPVKSPEEGEVKDLEPVDIPDIPTNVPNQAQPLPADVIPTVSKGVAITGLILQFAACAVIGLLAYKLYLDTQLPLFCGGCMP